MSMSDMAKPAFAGDARGARVRSAAKALWWSANRAAAQAMIKPPETDRPPQVDAARGPAPKDVLRRAWLDAFRKDSADVAAGLYPFPERGAVDPTTAFRRAMDVLSDARQVDARRRRGGGVEARAESTSKAYPSYYRQNFHFQSGGWFTPESADRYEAQVEALFSGAAGPMRRRALSLLARAWKAKDQRELTVVDVACGSGAFLTDLRAAFPRARVLGVDLSFAYAAKARSRSGAGVLQASAERLPFADASLDGVSCIYLFHELPPKVRSVVAREIARVLKPGGVLAFADSLQTQDEPDLGRLLQAFPAFFHEPFYESYQTTDLDELFSRSGLEPADRDRAFLTKAILLQKRDSRDVGPAQVVPVRNSDGLAGGRGVKQNE